MKKAKTNAKKKSVTPKKKAVAKKKSKLDQLKFADGKMDVEKVRAMEELLGIDQSNIFRTNDIEVFKENLAEMSLSDMQTLAAEAGVFPGGNKMTLKNRLTKEFVSQTKGRRFAAGEQRMVISPDDPNFEKVKNLMSEGF